MTAKGTPLAGVTVVDLTRALAGPYATLLLADAGASVTKIERPGGGDDARTWGPPFVGPPGAQESPYFLAVNRNKSSAVLDMKDPAGMTRLREMIAGADVLAENFRPGVMERLGLSEDELESLNDRLVVLSIKGFGEGGPEGHRPGFDQIAQGEGGMMTLTGVTGAGPLKAGLPVADILAGMFGAFGVAAALVERDRTGKGQWVRTSLIGAMIAVHTYQGTRWLLAGEVPEPEGNRHPLIAPYGAYRCSDGMINIAVASEGLWHRFAPLVGLDPDDPRYRTNADRVRRREELEGDLQPRLEGAGVDEWLETLDAAGVPAGRIRTIDQVYASPQVAHLGLVDELEHPSIGAIRLPGSPLSWSRSTPVPDRPPPTLGQHDGEVTGPGRRPAG